MEASDSQRSASSGDDVAVRRLTYERIAGELDRIRGARAYFARQLGPLPAFAGISVALVGAFSEKIEEEKWLWVALVLFGLMVAASIAYSRMPPYRELRSDRLHDKTKDLAEGCGTNNPADWYDAESKLERDIYSSPRNGGRFWWWPRRSPERDMQEQLNKERFGVFLVQTLFLCVIASLLLARLAP
jgi:hypothetical protein